MLFAATAAIALLGAILITTTSASRQRRILSSISKYAEEIVSEIKFRLSRPTSSALTLANEKTIFNKAQVEQEFSEATWQRQGYEDLVSIILAKEYGAKTFPCVYATIGYKANEQSYCFLKSEDPSEPANVRHIGACLSDYLKIAHSAGPNTSLVIMAPPPAANEPPKTVEDYLKSFWGTLKGLRRVDPKPWPKEYPEDMNSERWCFCFDDAPFFIVALTPAHEQRQSRYAPNFCMIVQPKWIFDTLFSTVEKRKAALKKVRGLLAEYDPIAASPDLKDYGALDSRETEQYFLLDHNTTAVCPYDKL